MTRRQKIHLTFSLLFILGLSLLVVGAVKSRNLLCTGLKVNIVDRSVSLVDARFLKHKAEKILGGSSVGRKLNTIDLQRLEDELENNPYIRHVEVYTDAKGVLVIDVWQARPLVKFVKDRQHYFIERNGQIFRVNKGTRYYAIVASGNLPRPEKNQAEPVEKYEVFSDIYKFANYIEQDTFWRFNIVQIHVNQVNDYELIPRVGDFVIRFGDADNMAVKFRNLKAFYQNMGRIGWDKYSVIDLRYKNQIVAVKKTK